MIQFTQKLLKALATVQFHFGHEDLMKIFGKENYQHMGTIWVRSKCNLLQFWSLLDTQNQELLFEYLDKQVFYLKK